MKKKKEAKLRVMDSRPLDAFKRYRRYRCSVCNFEVINIETLEMPKNTLQKSALNTAS